MTLYKKLNEKYNHDYYKIDENGEETQIQKDEYNKINYLIRGGDAISAIQLELRGPITKIIFRHEFIYDFLLPILDEYNREIQKKYKKIIKLIIII